MQQKSFYTYIGTVYLKTLPSSKTETLAAPPVWDFWSQKPDDTQKEVENYIGGLL